MFAGGGIWSPEKDRLDALRRVVVEDPDRVLAAIEDPGFLETFGPVSSHETLKASLPAIRPITPWPTFCATRTSPSAAA